jgi:osmotically-inducible protein OsmY
MTIFTKLRNSIFAVSLLFSLSACAAAVLGGAGTAGYTGVQERSIGGAVDDAVIHAEITSRFIQEDVNKLLVDVGVEVHEGRVLLTGAVKDPETQIDAVRIAWQPKGVKEVINEIQVTDKTTYKDVAKDIWITTQIRSKLLFNKHVRSINYSVETVNGIVYLMGLAQSEEELNTVTHISSTVKGVEKVISHVRSFEDDRR